MRFKLILLLPMLFLFVAEAKADVPSIGETKCVGNCGSSNRPSQPQVTSQPSYQPSYNVQDEENQKQKELERQRLREEADTKRKKEEFLKKKQDTLEMLNGGKSDDFDFKASGSGEDFGYGDSSGTNPGKNKNAAESHIRLKNNKALREAEASLYNTKEKRNPGAVFDTKGEASPHSYLAVLVPATGEPIHLSQREKRDPRMIKTLKELEKIQIKRRQLDAQRTRLAKERNNTRDPEEMKQLTKKLDKVEKDYQGNLLAASNTYNKVEKLKRTIDAEVEKPKNGK